MSRWRVVETYDDYGAFGYGAQPCDTVIKDWLTRAEAKCIYRHYEAKFWYNEFVTVRIEVLFDGCWEDVSQSWAYTAIAEQEDWFDRKGLDYNWWIQFGEIRKI